MTQTCVECTVRDAACYDYYVAVAEDAVAAAARDLHERSIANMAAFLKYDDAITTTERLAAVWAAAAARTPAATAGS
jgi:nicotinamidase-related amidase